jgi:hypothetical protein
MWYIIIFVIAAVSVIAGITGFTSCASPASPKLNIPPDSIKGSYSREEVKQLLDELANKKVKEELNMGASCYAPRAIEDSAEYICPVCGEKSIYTYSQAEFIIHEIPTCRQKAARFGTTTLKLDETQFCRKCRPDSIAQPRLCLVTKLEGQEPVRTCGVYATDLVILTDFFEGHNLYKTFNDGEVALKESIPRIKELLGIKE